MQQAAGLGADAGAPSASSGADERSSAVALPAGRQAFLEMLGELVGQGSLTPDDEAALVRQYDEAVLEIEQEKQRLEPEYYRRLEKDGREQADAWLGEAAHALGRRHGDVVRRIIESTPGFAAQGSNGAE